MKRGESEPTDTRRRRATAVDPARNGAGPLSWLVGILAAMAIVFALVAPAAGAPPASAVDAARQSSTPPKAREACGPCVAVAIVAIRTAAVKSAPKAIRGVGKKAVKGSRKAKRRIKGGARRSYSWAKRMKGKSRKAMIKAFHRIPKIARGCARGWADYQRTASLVWAAINCGRGIFDILVLRKDPLRPIDG